jgi:biopolymer transport protein TolQ
MSILELVLASGWMAKAVLLSLLGASVACWSIILGKRKTLQAATRQDETFQEFFWRGQSLDDILAQIHDFPSSPVARIFKAGVTELKRLAGNDFRGRIDAAVIENVSRSLARASNSEVTRLEKQVSVLATTASAAPFVGLFGTVWGIMTSFQQISAAGSANIAVVAPGISEALVTTAAGIAAAIPAVIAYNHFANQIRRAAVEMDSFSQDFLNLVQRSTVITPPPSLPVNGASSVPGGAPAR